MKDKTKFINILLIIAFTYVWIVNAWLSDDIHISFRSIEQLFAGNGMVFNKGERVQVFTHPLWYFLHLPFKLIFKDLYIVNFLLSFIFSSLAFWLAIRSKNTWIKLSIALPILFSKVFIDYTSSGLENPLSYFLIALLLTLYFKNTKNKTYIPLLSSLLILCRPDYVILTAPFIFYDILYNKNKLSKIFIGFLPLIIWELFSVFYYGTPFPNTMISKLNTGVELTDKIQMGVIYTWASALKDKVSFLFMFFAFVLGLLEFKKTKNIALLVTLISILIYCLGVLQNGGGFMAMRFFTIIFLMLAFVLKNIDLKLNIRKAVCFSFPFLSLFSATQTFIPIETYYPPAKIYESIDLPTIYKFTEDHGVVDERYFYYRGFGLIHLLQGSESYYFNHMLEVSPEPEAEVIVHFNMGVMPYILNNERHYIDLLALTDPLLSRLKPSKYWIQRVGHYKRDLPEGYVESIIQNKNLIKNKQVKDLYDDVYLATKADLFADGRFGAIVNLLISSKAEEISYKEDLDAFIESVPFFKDKIIKYVMIIKSNELKNNWSISLKYSLELRSLLKEVENIEFLDTKIKFFKEKIKNEDGISDELP